MTKGKIRNLIWRCGTKIEPKFCFFDPENAKMPRLTKEDAECATRYAKQIWGQDVNLDGIWAIKFLTEKGFDFHFERGIWAIQCSYVTANTLAFGYLGQ